MSRIHANSMDCAITQMDVFQVPPTMSQTEQGMWMTHKPVTNIADSGAIEFRIQGSSDHYLDLANTLLYTKVKITKADGSNLTATDNVAPTNLFLQSMFSQIDVYINEKMVTSASNTYGYRAILEKIANYTKEALKSKLTAEGFYKDTAGHMDSTDLTATGQNKGLLQRYELTKNSKPVEMIGGLHLDLMHMARYLLSDSTLRLKLTRAKPEFVLMSGEADANYKIVLMDISLDIRRVKIAPEVINAHAAVMLRQVTAKYPLRRTEVLSFSVAQGQLNTRQDNLFLGQLPQELIVGIVDSRAYNGTYSKNPFNFHHYNVNYINVSIDGQQLPFEALTPDFAAGQYIRCFNTLNTCLDNGVHSEKSICIDRDEYTKGYTLWAYNFTPDLSCGEIYEPVKTGNLHLEIKFAVPLPHTVNVVVLAEFQNLMQMDMSRSVISDFGK